MTNPTIVAVASASGRSGVAVLRLSGTDLRPWAEQLCGLKPRPRHAHVVSFRNAVGEELDQGLLLWFPAPASYTGEDVLELHTHGGDVLPRRVLQACLALGARHAEPGEFTRRAFEHGKLDLAQAEAVADLIEARSEAAARAALRSLSGEFSQEINRLRAFLEHLRVQLEGSIDFPEEELAVATRLACQQALQPRLAGLQGLLAQGLRGQMLRAGCRVVLLGPPNAGKSSLLNRLAGDALALVSDIPGTTRDAVRTELEVAGIRLELVDTAGLRSSADPVEKLGIARSHEMAAQADLILHLQAVDPAHLPSVPPATEAPTAPASRQASILPALPAELAKVPRLLVWNKIDLLTPAQREALPQGDPEACWVSAATGEGLAQLESRILSAVGMQANLESAFLARSRHLEALHATLQHLEAAAIAPADELMAEELRLAQRALDAIVGRSLPDQLLGEIFARFCIGK